MSPCSLNVCPRCAMRKIYEVITRLSSIRSFLRCLSCACLFLTTASLLLSIYSTVRRTSNDNPRRLYISNELYPFDRREQSILRYFQRKEQIMKQSPSKTILRNTFQKSLHKISFLIYEYTRHRQFCRKQNSTLVYIPTCPFQNCHFTCNSALIDEADAVLVLYSRLTYKKMLNLSISQHPNQIWLLWHDEPYSPSSVDNKISFNWTISYRLDSEISVAAYGITFVRDESMNQITFHNWIHENYKTRRNEATW
jgi:hypothetical protein